MKIENNNNILYIIIIIVCLLAISLGIYFVSNKLLDNNTTNNQISEKDLLSKISNLSSEAKINKKQVLEKKGLSLIDIIEPDFQFETHYFIALDKDGNIILDVRNLKDKDNDNNRYKYNGNFEYDEINNILSLYAALFLGESDESTGTAFNDKTISELSKDEKKKLGNYSDVVKYEYKFDNNKFELVKKTEISKLKDNEYYKNDLK